ncbi:hypothetical protein ACFU1R_06325 [Priestia megaterium]|uniref:hypothetical protein n=1 Tax=Priestia megaterium TaxID=1404 RepID=UPI00366B96FA
MATSNTVKKVLERLSNRGANKASRKALNNEISKQKDLGTFLPDDAYDGNLITPTRLRTKQQRTARQNSRVEKKRRRADEGLASLNTINPQERLLPAIGSTAKTLYGSARANLGEPGSLKRAGIGVIQSSAASAAVSGGMAAIQGNDPWEAAKSGAFKGAVAGVGYQGLKAATHAHTGSIKGNLKHIASTTKQTYQAHTVAGNTAMRTSKNGVSNQLKRVLDANQASRKTESIFGLNK